MNNLELAEITCKAFNALLNQTTNKARSGSNAAAKDVMSQMTAKNNILKMLGYMEDDDSKLVPYTPNNDPLVKLALKAKDGDTDAALELLNYMTKQNL